MLTDVSGTLINFSETETTLLNSYPSTSGWNYSVIVLIINVISDSRSYYFILKFSEAIQPLL